MAIAFFLADSEVSASEVEELDHLAALLCITNEEKEKIYTAIRDVEEKISNLKLSIGIK